MRCPLLSILLLPSLPLAAHPGHDHGPVDDAMKFTLADADESGNLTPAEFSTTFSTVTPRGKIQRAFKKADADRNGLLSLEEWLAYRSTTPEGKARTAFTAADANEDGFLDLDEFAAPLPPKKAFIHTRAAFLGADEDGDSLLSLEEWLAHSLRKGAGKPRVSFSKFDLADLDASNSVTPDEFVLVYPPRAKPSAIMKKFDKLDRNDDSELTRDEWNPGAKGNL